MRGEEWAARGGGAGDARAAAIRSPTPSSPLPRYSTLAASAALLIVGLQARPDSSIATWARGEAQKEEGA